MSLQDNFVSRGRPKCILDPMSLLKALLSLQGLPQDRLAKDSCACLVSLGDFLCEFVPSLSLFKQEVVLLSCFQKGAPMCSRHPVCFTSILGHSEDLLCFIAFFYFSKIMEEQRRLKKRKGGICLLKPIGPPSHPSCISSCSAIPSASRNPSPVLPVFNVIIVYLYIGLVSVTCL